MERLPPSVPFLAALALVTQGCGKPSAPSEAAPIQPPVASLRAAAPSTPKPRALDEPGMCVVAKGDHRATPEAVALAPKLPFGECWSTPRGAWSLSLQDSGAWVAVHVDANGVTTRLARAFDAGNGADPNGPSVPSFGYVDRAWAKAYDFDGDGDRELFVGIHGIWSAQTGLELAESVLYTWKDGAIRRFEPAAKIAIWSLEDVDGDGRPDLRTSSPYSSSRGGSTPVFSPDLVAHSLADGTFSMDDAVASAAMRKVCPKPPRLAALTAAISGDRVAHGRDIACARVWGVSAEAIANQLHLDPKAPHTWPEVLGITPPTLLH